MIISSKETDKSFRSCFFSISASVFSTLINEMLNCYLVTARCNLFVVAGTPDTPPQNGAKPTTLPYPQYVGVDRKLTYHGIMTHRVLVGTFSC